MVNENDLCFVGQDYAPLKDVLGLTYEEIDALYDEERVSIKTKDNKCYEAFGLCELSNSVSAVILAEYASEFYKGRPALTVNNFGNGKAYYIAFRSNDDFLPDFYNNLISDLRLKTPLATNLPENVNVQSRTDGKNEFIFVMNFNEEEKINLGYKKYYDMINGATVSGDVTLDSYGVLILKKEYE